MAQKTSRHVGNTPMNAPAASTGPPRIRLMRAAHIAQIDDATQGCDLIRSVVGVRLAAIRAPRRAPSGALPSAVSRLAERSFTKRPSVCRGDRDLPSPRVRHARRRRSRFCFPCATRHARRPARWFVVRCSLRLPAAMTGSVAALPHRASSDSGLPAVECSGHAKAAAASSGQHRPTVTMVRKQCVGRRQACARTFSARKAVGVSWIRAST